MTSCCKQTTVWVAGRYATELRDHLAEGHQEFERETCVWLHALLGREDVDVAKRSEGEENPEAEAKKET